MQTVLQGQIIHKRKQKTHNNTNRILESRVRKAYPSYSFYKIFIYIYNIYNIFFIFIKK